MEPHTKIVEFYGLPGCGKTTLKNYLVKIEEQSEDCQFSIIDILITHFKKLSLWGKITSIPFKAWYFIVRFLLSVPFLPVKEWKFYTIFFDIALIYNLKSKIHSSSYILVDHGLFQAVQSVIYSKAVTLSERSWRLLQKIADLLNVDYAVYCSVSTELSLQRIRKRNRKGNGRLDMIKDDNTLLIALEQQRFFFEKVNIFSEKVKGTTTITLDTSLNLSEIANMLISKL